jgi:hypothetical protein
MPQSTPYLAVLQAVVDAGRHARSAAPVDLIVKNCGCAFVSLVISIVTPDDSACTCNQRFFGLETTFRRRSEILQL